MDPLRTIQPILEGIQRTGLLALLPYLPADVQEAWPTVVASFDDPQREYRLRPTSVRVHGERLRFAVERLYRGWGVFQRDAQGWRMSVLADDPGDRIAHLPEGIATLAELARTLAEHHLRHPVWIDGRAVPLSLYGDFARSPERLAYVEIARCESTHVEPASGVIHFVGVETPLPIELRFTPTVQITAIAGQHPLRYLRRWLPDDVQSCGR